MIKLISILLISLTFTACSNTQPIYKPLSQKHVDKIMNQFDEVEPEHPIDLKGYTRSQLLSFSIQTTPNKAIKGWCKWAYKKINDSIIISMKENISISSEQDRKFKAIMKLKPNRANIFKFMLIMTDEQIRHVG